jgi:putative NIF3 family GTP cyclohydrolase 1 type 2
MTARELLQPLIEVLGKPLNPDEGFRFGDLSVAVHGVQVCWMCDPNAIAAAVRAQANVIVCHEALFYPYDIVDGGQFGGKAADFLSWPTNVQRVRLLAEHDLTVIRAHGSVDQLCIFDVFAEQLGLGKPVVDEPDYIKLFEISPRPVSELARDIKQRLGLATIRAAIRDPDRIVRRIGSTWGGMGLFVNVAYPNQLLEHHPDVLIAGETDNYGFRFVTELGIDVIETSHEVSEDAGLQEFARRVASRVDVPVSYFKNPIVWQAV